MLVNDACIQFNRTSTPVSHLLLIQVKPRIRHRIESTANCWQTKRGDGLKKWKPLAQPDNNSKDVGLDNSHNGSYSRDEC